MHRPSRPRAPSHADVGAPLSLDNASAPGRQTQPIVRLLSVTQSAKRRGSDLLSYEYESTDDDSPAHLHHAPSTDSTIASTDTDSMTSGDNNTIAERDSSFTLLREQKEFWRVVSQEMALDLAEERSSPDACLHAHTSPTAIAAPRTISSPLPELL